MNFKYERPDMKAVQEAFEKHIAAFKAADKAEDQIKIVNEINTLRNTIETAFTLVSIRHSINTEDAFYDAENDFVDENQPLYTELVDKYYRALAASPFEKELRQAFGDHLFNIIDVNLKVFSP